MAHYYSDGGCAESGREKLVLGWSIRIGERGFESFSYEEFAEPGHSMQQPPAQGLELMTVPVFTIAVLAAAWPGGCASVLGR